MNAHKTKIMAFFCSIPLQFCYNGTPLKILQEFKYLGMTLQPQWEDDECLKPDGMQLCWRHSQRMEDLLTQLWGLGIKNWKHAMLWIFQDFALSAGLYGCQAWATNTPTFKSFA